LPRGHRFSSGGPIRARALSLFAKFEHEQGALDGERLIAETRAVSWSDGVGEIDDGAPQI
jgi:hypothetical protein